MTPKELTEEEISLYNLAKEAGFDVAQWAINGGIEVVIYEEGPITGELTRFAALVAAHEREACANVCEEHETWYGNSGSATTASNKFIRPKTWAECAAAIRARGEK